MKEAKAKTYLSKSKINYKCLGIVRILSTIIVVTHYFLYNAVDTFPEFLINTMKYLTYWGLVSSSVYLIQMIFARSNSRILTGYIAMLNHYVVSLNFMITLFYFALLFDANKPFSITLYLSIFNHFIPLLFTLLEFSLNNHVFYFNNIPKLYVLPLSYFVVLIIFTFTTGEPVYSTFTFEDIFTLVYIIAAIFLFGISSILAILFQMAIKSCTYHKYKEDTSKIENYTELATNKNIEFKNDKTVEIVDKAQKNEKTNLTENN